jgi:hypothetical protein
MLRNNPPEPTGTAVKGANGHASLSVTSATVALGGRFQESSANDASRFSEPSKTVDTLFNAIYPVEDLLSGSVRTAQRLLDDACDRMKKAIAFKENGDEFGADDQVSHVVNGLRELFCVREIGDGFGAVVNATLAGLENLSNSVVPFASVHQLTAVLRRLERIQKETFISLAGALVEIERLEGAALDVRPGGVVIVDKWLHVVCTIFRNKDCG